LTVPFPWTGTSLIFVSPKLFLNSTLILLFSDTLNFLPIPKDKPISDVLKRPLPSSSTFSPSNLNVEFKKNPM